MSDASDEDRGWRPYIQNMLEFAEKVLSYTNGMDQAAFLADERTYDATLRNLELIGEAATHVPRTVREQHPDIQWRQIIATRNRVAHGYLGMDEVSLGHHSDRHPGPPAGAAETLVRAPEAPESM